MTSISPQQARARFKIVPSALQDIIFSLQTSEIIRRIAEQNHLPQEKIGGIAEAVGFVLLGFLHPEEAAREIQERAGIDMQVAKAIADAIDSRLFRPIRGELDRLYAPAPHEGEAPTMIHEVKKPDSGERVVRLDSLRLEGKEGVPSGAPTPTPPAPTVSSGPSALMETPLKPQTMAPPPAPPLIIHQESTAEPMKKVPSMGFGASNQFDAIKTEIKIPPRPARLEIGGTWPPKAPAEKPAASPPAGGPPKPITEAPRAIHYGQFRTPIEERKIAPPPVAPPAPTVSSGPASQQFQKPAPPSNLPVIPETSPKTLIIEEGPKQKSIPPQGIMPQAKPQPPTFLSRQSAELRPITPPAPTVSSGPIPAPLAQKEKAFRTLPKPPSPPPPPRTAETQAPKGVMPPAGTVPQTARPVPPPPMPAEKNSAAPPPPPPAPTTPSGQASGPPPQREPVIDLDTLKERAGG